MAEVYRANHRTLERTVALKVINPEFNMDPTFSIRFLREAKTVARLNHPNIITIYDFDEQGDIAYLVMELAPGGTFRDQARSFRTLSEAVEGLAPIGAALEYAHGRGVIHRDVKPINILINDHGRPVLADFGLARIATESLDLWTFAGTSAGSPHYMPPEQALGKEIDHRADIYALGIVAYQVFTGRLPYHGQSPLAIMHQHITEPSPSVQAILPDAPAALDAAIQRATAKQPSDRFDSAMAFIVALQQAAAKAPTLLIGAESARSTAEQQPWSATDRVAQVKSTKPPGTAVSPDGDVTIITPAADLSEKTVLRTDAPTVIVRAMPPGVMIPKADDATIVVPSAIPATPRDPFSTIPVLNGIGINRKHGRPTSLNPLQWAVLGSSLAVLLFIIGVTLWLMYSGRTVSGTIVGGLTMAVFNHHVVIRKMLAVIALLLAILNVTLMRVAIVEDFSFMQETYRRLRQNHRFVGYTSAHYCDCRAGTCLDRHCRVWLIDGKHAPLHRGRVRPARLGRGKSRHCTLYPLTAPLPSHSRLGPARLLFARLAGEPFPRYSLKALQPLREGKYGKWARLCLESCTMW